MNSVNLSMSEIPATTSSSSHEANEQTRKILYSVPNKGNNRRHKSHISSDEDESSSDENKRIIVHHKYLESNI